MNIRFVVTDLDGTALPTRAGASVARRVTDAVAAAQAAGICVTAATGRPVSGATHVLSQLGIFMPVVVSGGTKLYDPLHDKVFWRSPLPDDGLAFLIEIAGLLPYETLIDEEAHGDGDLAYRRFSASYADGPHAAYLVGVPAHEAAGVVELLRRAPGIAAAISTHPFPGDFVDIQITSVHGTKAGGVTRLLEHLGAHPHEALGVGDSENDLPLFSAVGHRVAMGNAVPTLKASAHVVVPSVEDHGLAITLESLALDPTGAHLAANWAKSMAR
jgi:hydroxymethylpyrimidine pyrophosphatase-like HAD family hydrolase